MNKQYLIVPEAFELSLSHYEFFEFLKIRKKCVNIFFTNVKTMNSKSMQTALSLFSEKFIIPFLHFVILCLCMYSYSCGLTCFLSQSVSRLGRSAKVNLWFLLELNLWSPDQQLKVHHIVCYTMQ